MTQNSRLPWSPGILASRPWALSLIALGAAACLGETTLVIPPKAPPTTITLSFKADSDDLATATALGWADGIPGVAVTVTPEDTTLGPPRQFQSSDAGVVMLGELAGGRYVVDGERWLTDAERAQLLVGDDVVGFVTRLSLNTASTAANVSTEMAASRRRGVVFSEWKGEPLFTPQEGTYFGSEYVRLYNNADTTIYLDGLIIGDGLAWQFDYPNFPCSRYTPYVLDPGGIWSHLFYEFPGRGKDYPLSPGETAVLATDAIDHRPLFSEGLDLRGADFEFYEGGGDVDNPDVPNLVDVGTWSDPTGHGLIWSALANVAFLARPFDLASTPTAFISESAWRRIPAAALLDVMAVKTTYQSGYPECSWLVDPNFDRDAVRLAGSRPEDDLLAYRRREVPFSMGGRPVLQHTRTSAWDFTLVTRAPFARP